MEAARKLVAWVEDGLEHRTALVVASSKVRGTWTSLKFQLPLRMPEYLQHAAGTCIIMTGMVHAASG